jgi:hypothetical protein
MPGAPLEHLAKSLPLFSIGNGLPPSSSLPPCAPDLLFLLSTPSAQQVQTAKSFPDKSIEMSDEESKAVKRGMNRMAEGSARAFCRDEAAAGAPLQRRPKVSQTCCLSAEQAGAAAHAPAQAAAAVPAAVISAGMSIADLSSKAAETSPAQLPSAASASQISVSKPSESGRAVASPPHAFVSFFDRYLRRDMRAPAKQLGQAMLPCNLVRAALCVRAQRSRHSPPPLQKTFLPWFWLQVQFLPLQLQRFLRSCVLATAHALVTPPASVFRLVDARTKSRWIERIFVRVMSGFVARAEVRRQGARCARALILCMRWHGLAVISLTHCAANAGGYNGIMNGDAEASAALPNAVLLHAHALLLCRLPLPPALQAKTALVRLLLEATSLPCKII